MTTPEPFTVISWNILMDKTRSALEKDHPHYIKPQSERIESQAEVIAGLGVSLDVVVIQEAQKEQGVHYGEKLARMLGFEVSFWFNHNTSKRKGEYIGVFGNRVEHAKAFELGHDKKAVITRIGNTAVAGIHFRKEHIGPKRTRQARALIEHLVATDPAVREYCQDVAHWLVAGDPNSLKWQKACRVLHDAGLESVFELAGLDEPKTHPTDPYRNIFYAPIHRPFLPGGTASDIIYARGMNVHGEPFVFEGDSDHRGLVITVSEKVA